MKLRIQKKIDVDTLASGMAFLLSPFLALPGIVFGIIKKQRTALILFTIFVALIEYQLIPKTIDDLARHYALFEEMGDMSIKSFLNYLKTRPDFLFYWIMYMFAKMGLSARLFASFVVFLTLNNFFLVFYRFFKQSSVNLFSVGLLMLIFSFQWKLLLMGLRNYMAFSFVFLAFFNAFFEKGRKGYPYLIIACFIHFSSILFVPVYLVFNRIKKQDAVCLILFICSLGFVFIPKEFLLTAIAILPLKGNIQEKAIGYLTGLDIIEEAMLESKSAVVLYYIKILWTYFAYVYLLITYKRKSILRNLVYVLLFIMNVFSAAPDIFTRIGYVARPVLIFLIIYECFRRHKNKLFLQLFFLVFLLYNFTIIYILKDVLFNSLFDMNTLFTYSIFTEDAPLSERY